MEEDNTLGNKQEKWIKHYSSSHKILLVGEGDFSFSSCLANAFGYATNMVATSRDPREELLSKYTRAVENLKDLEDLGCNILHGIDAHTMSEHAFLKLKVFDRIVFNFPHSGFNTVFREHDSWLIRRHQDLVRGFLRSAKKMLAENGEVHITHKTAYPFSKWEIEELAEKEGLSLVEKEAFYRSDYQGYENKRGDGISCDLAFPVGQSSTFKFNKASEKLIKKKKKTRHQRKCS
ncbi:hypothetical protein SLE2022_399720 [Rubroshorea leprosula]